MKRSPGPRRTASLSDSVQRRLNLYALAASGAGVGILASAKPAEAKIVYTPAHRVIKAHHYYQLDLNHDKKIDFTISNSATCATDECFYFLLQKPAVGNSGMVGFKGSYVLASALKPGTRIGPSGVFSQRAAVMVGIDSAYPFNYVFGQWVSVQRRYLGLRFKIKGRTHYGWARLNVQVVLPPHPAITAVLTGYAYETVPGKGIFAGKTGGPDEIANDPEQANAAALNVPTPEPATLGALAMGMPGLSIWRQEELLSAEPEVGLTLKNR